MEAEGWQLKWYSREGGEAIIELLAITTLLLNYLALKLGML